MNRFLPSKKLLVFLGIILVGLGCFIVFSKFKERKISYFLNKGNSEEIIKTTNKISQQALKNDSDGDGLKDWEEILWKTDPQNPDTDGDGTDDNTEVLSKRNPLVAGPDDLLNDNTSTSTNTKNNPEYNKPLTQTDILSRELFTGYVALKQKGQLGTKQEEQFINNLITKNLSTQVNPIKKYKLSDLNINQDDNQKTFQQYIENFKEISIMGDPLEHDVAIVKRALEKKDPKELNKLKLNAKTYKKMQEKLLRMSVPSELSLIHLEIINTLNNLLGNNADMMFIFEDPIIGIKSTQSYVDNGLILANKVKEIILFFNKKNIKF